MEAVRQFCAWRHGRVTELAQFQPIIIAGYIEQLCESKSKPTVKQHLATIRRLCDYLVLDVRSAGWFYFMEEFGLMPSWVAESSH